MDACAAAAGDADLRNGGGATPGGSGLNPPPPSMLMAGLAGLLVSAAVAAAAAAVVVEAIAVALRLVRSALELCGERAPASDGAADGADAAAAPAGAVGVAAPPPAAFFFAWNFLSWWGRRARDVPFSLGALGERANRCACLPALLHTNTPFPLLARLWRRALPRLGRPHRPPWLLLTAAMQDREMGKVKCARFPVAYEGRRATGRRASLQ